MTSVRLTPSHGRDGVVSIQCHLNSIEATFVVLSLSDKQRALQLIITFLQKLEISTYNNDATAPHSRPEVESVEVGVGSLSSNDESSPKRRFDDPNSTKSALSHPPSLAEDDNEIAKPLLMKPPTVESMATCMLSEDKHLHQECADDRLSPSCSDDGSENTKCGLSTETEISTPTTVNAVSQQSNSADLVSRKEKSAHLNSEFVWGDECDDFEVAKGGEEEEEEDAFEPETKVMKFDDAGVVEPSKDGAVSAARSSFRTRGVSPKSLTRRNCRKNSTSKDKTVKAAVENGDDHDSVDGLGMCDGRTTVEADAAVVIDKMIECLENGTAYDNSQAAVESNGSLPSLPTIAGNHDKVHFFARQAMRPYRLSPTSARDYTAQRKGGEGSSSTTPVAPLTCGSCGKTFSRRRNLQSHLQQDHDTAELSCRTCRRAFINPEEWLHHGCANGYSTTKNGLVTTPLKKSKKAPVGTPASEPAEIYCCPICQVLMEAAVDLQKHLFDHVKNQCRVCLQLLKSKKELTSHMQKEHHQTIPESAFICRFCQRRFSKVTTLYLHLKVHVKEDEKVCFKCGFLSASSSDFEKHMQAHALHAHFTCDKCSSTFHRRPQFQSHLRCHQKWDCSMCDEKHSHRRAFELHCKRKHGMRLIENKTFPCPHCDASEAFSSRYKLRLHIAQTHSQKRPHVCDPCNMSFTEESKLKRHEESETHLQKVGLPPLVSADAFHCQSCEAFFNKKDQLDRHLKVHTEDRPFSCPLCAFSCKEKANLKNHMKRHTSERDFACANCDKTFQTKKTLEDHVIYVHSDRRNFACESCPKAFKSKKDLLRHRRSVHANIKPHICKVCNAAFKRKALVRSHLLVVHGITLPTSRVKKFDQPDENGEDEMVGINPDSLVENLLVKNRTSAKNRRTESSDVAVADIVEKVMKVAPSGEEQLSNLASVSSTVVAGDAGRTTEATVDLKIQPPINWILTPSASDKAQTGTTTTTTPTTQTSTAKTTTRMTTTKKRTKDTLLRQMLAETECETNPRSALTPLQKKSPLSSSSSSSMSRLKSAILGETSPTVLSSPSSTPSFVAPAMTEIIVTVDSEGAIMGVDGAAPETQAFIPVKGADGETTYVPFPISSNQSTENESPSMEYSVKSYEVELGGLHNSTTSSVSTTVAEMKPILIANTSSGANGFATLTTTTTGPSSGLAHAALHQEDPIQYPVIKALKGLDVRLPPSIAALEEERFVEGISFEQASSGVVLASSQLSPNVGAGGGGGAAAGAGGLFRCAASIPTQSFHANNIPAEPSKRSTVALAPIRTIDRPDVDVPHQFFGRPQIIETMVNGEDGEAYYLMETDDKEPQEVYYVVSDAAQYL